MQHTFLALEGYLSDMTGMTLSASPLRKQDVCDVGILTIFKTNSLTFYLISLTKAAKKSAKNSKFPKRRKRYLSTISLTKL